MKVAAISLSVLGMILILASVLIYFKTDARAVTRELKRAKKPEVEKEPINEKLSTIYYEEQKEELTNGPEGGKGEEVFVHKREKTFLRGIGSEAQDDTALLVYSPPIVEAENKENKCDTEPLEQRVPQIAETEPLEGETEPLKTLSQE